MRSQLSVAFELCAAMCAHNCDTRQSCRLVTIETLNTILTIENLDSWQSLLPDNQEWQWTAFAILAMFLNSIFPNCIFSQAVFLAVHRQLNRWPCHWVTHLLILTLRNNPRDFWPLRHLIRVMRRHDLTQKNLPTNIPTYLPTSGLETTI